MSFLALATAVLAAAASAASADSARYAGTNWDIGLDPGMIYPVSHREYSHVVPNSLDYNLLANETVGDEVAEGFVAPPPNGTSVVAATNAPAPEVSAHVYRRVGDGLSVGLLVGWSNTHSNFIDNSGVYDQPGFTRLGYSSWYIHVAPVVRVERPQGFARPFITAGPELNLINEHATAYFIDPDDSVRPEDVVDKTHVFAAGVAGVGCDFWLTSNGSIGLSAEFHKVLSSGVNMDYITPHVVLSVYY